MYPAGLCDYCGAPLEAGHKFCETCGQPVTRQPSTAPTSVEPQSSVPDAAPPPTPKSTSWNQTGATPPTTTPVRQSPPPAYTPPPSKPPSNRLALPIVLGLVGLCLIACVAAALLGGYFVFQQPSETQSMGLAEQAAATLEAMGQALPTMEPRTPELPPPATLAPVAPQPSTAPLSPAESPVPTQAVITGAQSRDENMLVDDFSSNAFGWSAEADDVSVTGFESGSYFMQVIQPEYLVWAYLPVEFNPQAIEFKGALIVDDSGVQDGLFGVLCHYQDENNYDLVGIDVKNRAYVIQREVAGETTTLSESGAQGAAALDPWPTAWNHFLVDCSLDLITLFINDQLQAQAALDPLAQPGRMALFVQTMTELSPTGYKVFFDDLSAWKPVQ